MRRIAIQAVLLTALVAASGVPARAQGCSGCRAALEFSEEGRQLMASLESGILLLMGAPYLMIGAAGYAIVRAYRKNRNRTEDGTDDRQPPTE